MSKNVYLNKSRIYEREGTGVFMNVQCGKLETDIVLEVDQCSCKTSGVGVWVRVIPCRFR